MTFIATSDKSQQQNVSPGSPPRNGHLKIYSSDGSIFYFDRARLQAASPVFNTTIELGDLGEFEQVVQLTEDAAVITNMLSVVDEDSIDPVITSDNWQSFLQAAAKYDIKIMVDHLIESVQTSNGALKDQFRDEAMGLLSLADLLGVPSLSSMALGYIVMAPSQNLIHSSVHLRSPLWAQIMALREERAQFLIKRILDTLQHRMLRLAHNRRNRHSNCVECPHNLLKLICVLPIVLGSHPSWSAFVSEVSKWADKGKCCNKDGIQAVVDAVVYGFEEKREEIEGLLLEDSFLDLEQDVLRVQSIQHVATTREERFQW
ncbi:hypothetical protein CPB86DRAFT_878472 [Serendipita vermifera]|nr:hypothetical protein CPB86DRAFT_878472 [Serendipita vermifera]